MKKKEPKSTNLNKSLILFLDRTPILEIMPFFAYLHKTAMILSCPFLPPTPIFSYLHKTFLKETHKINAKNPNINQHTVDEKKEPINLVLR